MSGASFYILGVVLVVFAGIGFIRGWLRELSTLAGLVLVWMAVVAAGPLLVTVVNRLGLVVAFTWRGGFDAVDPAWLLNDLRASPAIDPARPDVFFAVLFALGIVASYLAVGRYVAGPATLTAQLLGTLAGAINGSLLAYVLLRYVSPAASLDLSLSVSAEGAADVLGQQLTLVVAAAGVLALGIGLFSVLRRSRGTRGSGRDRARGRG